MQVEINQASFETVSLQNSNETTGQEMIAYHEASIQSVSRRRKGYEVEDATLVEMAALLDSLSQKYKSELERRIEDCRLLQSSIRVAELNQSYLQAESDVIKSHIGNLFSLYRQSSGELRVMRRWLKKLYPGWNRVFSEVSRQAIGDG